MQPYFYNLQHHINDALLYMVNITNTCKNWLNELKQYIHSSQMRAALKVNAELLSLYWHLGKEILDKEKNKKWGRKLIDKLSKDLIDEFPSVKGFSRMNLYRIRRWVLFYTQNSSIVPPPVVQLQESAQSPKKQSDIHDSAKLPDTLLQIPWKHHLEIIQV